MPSNSASRKLFHIHEHLTNAQIKMLETMTCGKDWDKIKQEFIDRNEAMLIVSKLRDESLGWRG